MGLDNYAVIVNEREKKGTNAPDEKFKGINLCGGMFSGGQESSGIRGKVYDNLIERLTSESLYQEIILPDTVEKMSVRLDQVEYDDLEEEDRNYFSKEVFDNLKKWFSVCAENGYGIAGWW